MLDFAVLSGVTVGVTQLIKGFLPSKWVPLASVLLAIGFACILGLSKGVPLVQSIVEGLIAGLVANGLYDNVKAHISE